MAMTKLRGKRHGENAAVEKKSGARKSVTCELKALRRRTAALRIAQGAHEATAMAVTVGHVHTSDTLTKCHSSATYIWSGSARATCVGMW